MRLEPLTDHHFGWMLGERDAPAAAPRLPEGGLADPDVLKLFRQLANDLGGDASWLMIVEDEAVGIISVKERDAAGRWDIGYTVAPMRERRGHAKAAVAALIPIARAAGAAGLTAETLPDSEASPRLLRGNGFSCVGRYNHPEDGWVDQWVMDWTR